LIQERRAQLARREQLLRRKDKIASMKYWEIIADNLSKAGWSLGYVSAVDSHGRTIFIADAHCDDGKRFIVRADEKLTAFVELESAIRAGLLLKQEHATHGRAPWQSR
jgi:hypothetical protein